MGPDLQLAVRLDWDWMVNCTVYRRQKVNSKADRNQEPQPISKLNFMRLLEAFGSLQCSRPT